MESAVPVPTGRNSRLESPPASSITARAVMRGNRSTDTKPERALRSELHRRGLRFRKHKQVIAGLRFRPDVIFPRERVAVDFRGCFWHRCELHAVLPKSNMDYWLPKLETNVQRDYRNAIVLAEHGWVLEVVWEHENVVAAADRIEKLVRSRREGRSTRASEPPIS